MKTGAAKDWRAVLKDATNDDMNAKAMLRYFEPLMVWLKEKNKGKKYTLPETL
jgi:peptidyl-dipeptidase A